MIADALMLTGITLAGIAFFIRAWAVLYLAGYVNDQLLTEGPFSLCRNPIYLSTIIGATGVALQTQTLSFPLLLVAVLLVYLNVHIGGEERRLLKIHGQRFLAYRASTPRFVPHFSKLNEPERYIVHPHEFRRWLLDGLWIVYGIGFILLTQWLHASHILPVLWRLY